MATMKEVIENDYRLNVTAEKLVDVMMEHINSMPPESRQAFVDRFNRLAAEAQAQLSKP